MDIAINKGAEVYATGEGIVVEAKNLPKGFGKRVVISHSGEQELLTRYAHLDSYIVIEGEKVRKGDVIGFVGSTGLSTAPHLHYEVIDGGEFQDPKDFIDDYSFDKK